MGIFSKLFGSGDAGPAPGPAPRGGGRRILVVEPSITVAKVVELTLEHDSVTHAANAAQAREAFTAQHPQLVLVSANLPDGDGYELARSFINDEFRGCPVILLRGAFEVFDQAKAEATGVAGILGKPFSADQLRDAVERSGV